MKNHKERPGKGVLFTNDKRKTDTQPHLKGGFTADRDIKQGEWVKLAGWRKPTPVGELISLAQDNFMPDPNYKKPTEGSTVREYSPHRDDEIPF
jgi:hypothetical protein